MADNVQGGAVSLGNLVTTVPSRFSAIQPDLLPPMALLEAISSEAIIAARMQQLKTNWLAHDPPNAAAYDLEQLEFDPLKINAETAAYFETLLRDRVNQAAKGVTLAYGVGADLDAIGSRYPYGVPRKTVASGTWTGSGTQEPDATYRQRIWLSPNILSLNGPGQGVYESYVFWAMSAPLPSGERPIKHASALTIPATGKIYIPIMSAFDMSTTWVRPPSEYNVWTLTTNSNPVPTSGQISAVYQYITQTNAARQGLTDIVNVIAPKVKDTTIDAEITLFPGVDVLTLMTEVGSAVVALVQALQWIGADLTNMALKGALARAGVYNAKIKSPTDDVSVGMDGVVNVSGIRLAYVGTGE